MPSATPTPTEPEPALAGEGTAAPTPVPAPLATEPVSPPLVGPADLPVITVKPSLRIDALAVQSVVNEMVQPSVGAGLMNLENATGSTLSSAALNQLASGTTWKAVDSVAATAAPAQVELIAQRMSNSTANLNLAKVLRSAKLGTLN
jgi:hypothetical protein